MLARPAAIDGADADEQLVGDLLAGLVLGEKHEHAAFGVGQRGEPGLTGGPRVRPFQEIVGQERRHVVPAGRDRSYRRDDFGHGAVLQHVALHAEIYCFS
jgi:hypothetical protein